MANAESPIRANETYAYVPGSGSTAALDLLLRTHTCFSIAYLPMKRRAGSVRSSTSNFRRRRAAIRLLRLDQYSISSVLLKYPSSHARLLHPSPLAIMNEVLRKHRGRPPINMPQAVRLHPGHSLAAGADS